MVDIKHGMEAFDIDRETASEMGSVLDSRTKLIKKSCRVDMGRSL